MGSRDLAVCGRAFGKGIESSPSAARLCCTRVGRRSGESDGLEEKNSTFDVAVSPTDKPNEGHLSRVGRLDVEEARAVVEARHAAT